MESSPTIKVSKGWEETIVIYSSWKLDSLHHIVDTAEKSWSSIILLLFPSPKHFSLPTTQPPHTPESYAKPPYTCMRCDRTAPGQWRTERLRALSYLGTSGGSSYKICRSFMPTSHKNCEPLSTWRLPNNSSA